MKSHMEEVVRERPKPEQRAAQQERLKDFALFHIRFHLERADAVFIAYMELRNLTDSNFAEIEMLRRQYEDELEDILRAGIECGAFELEDTKIAARAIIAMLNGINTWYRVSGKLILDDVKSIYWKMLRKMVGV